MGGQGTPGTAPTHFWPLTQGGELETEDSAGLTAHQALLTPAGGLQPLLAVGCAHQKPVLPGAGGHAYYLEAGGRKAPGQGTAWQGGRGANHLLP